MNNIPKKKLGRKFLVIGTILFPLFSCLYFVSLNSSKLIGGLLSYIVIIFSCLSFVLLLVGGYFYLTGKDKVTKFKKGFRYTLGTLAFIYVLGGYSVITILYFPGSKFKDWLITTAMTTMNHQYFATWFYDDYDVDVVMSNNSVIESGEDTNPDMISFVEPDFDGQTYENEYEKQILSRGSDNDVYKIIDIRTNKFKGKMAVVYDPSKVILGVSKGTGTSLSSAYGQFINEIADRYNAKVALNGGGFYDPDWNSTGGVPHGVVISQGKLIANNIRAGVGGGIIGFNSENKLILSRMSAKEALNAGIRDAVDFGPFLIVNGKSSFINGNGGWGDAPRSAIAQRRDGIVLLLAIDGRQSGSVGADMNDVAELLLNYGAINASNLDGGTSTAMSENGSIISSPRNGSFQAKTRPVPNAWLVLE